MNSEEAGLGERQVTTPPNDDVILHRDIEHPPGLHKLLGCNAIVRRWSWIAARMIVNENDCRRILGNRLAKNLSRVNER